MQLFFHQNLENNTLELPEDESKHCVRVLRKKVGDEIMLIDGKGNKAICKITDDNQKKCKLEVVEKFHFPAKAIGMHIAIAPTKNFDRMDWMLEKCTEIGVSEITFIETENSERNKINMERCEKILIQSIKQSKSTKPIYNSKREKKELPKTSRIDEFSLRKRNVLLDKFSRPKLN